MKVATYLGFFDELDSINLTKEAGMLRDIGMRIVTKARGAPRAAADFVTGIPSNVRGSIDNAGKTVSAFSTPIQSAKRGLKMTTTDFKSVGNGQKALMGFGLASGAHEALAKNDPLGQGRGRVERAATAVGDQIGGLIGTPFGITGGIVGGQIGRKAGSLVGKGAQAVHRSFKKPAPQP